MIVIILGIINTRALAAAALTAAITNTPFGYADPAAVAAATTIAATSATAAGPAAAAVRASTTNGTAAATTTIWRHAECGPSADYDE